MCSLPQDEPGDETVTTLSKSELFSAVSDNTCKVGYIASAGLRCFAVCGELSQSENYFLVLFQVYPLEGEAVQVCRMWQRVLPVSDAGRAQDPAHGGVATQVSGV